MGKTLTSENTHTKSFENLNHSDKAITLHMWRKDFLDHTYKINKDSYIVYKNKKRLKGKDRSKEGLQYIYILIDGNMKYKSSIEFLKFSKICLSGI